MNQVEIICITVLLCLSIVSGTVIIMNNGNGFELDSLQNEPVNFFTQLLTGHKEIEYVEWVDFYLDGNPNTGVDATIYVGEDYAGQEVEIQMDYSRDGYQFQSDPYRNYTVADDGSIFVRTYSALNKYPDECIIKIRQNNPYTVLCPMEKHKGTQHVYVTNI